MSHENPCSQENLELKSDLRGIEMVNLAIIASMSVALKSDLRGIEIFVASKTLGFQLG